MLQKCPLPSLVRGISWLRPQSNPEFLKPLQRRCCEFPLTSDLWPSKVGPLRFGGALLWFIIAGYTALAASRGKRLMGSRWDDRSERREKKAKSLKLRTVFVSHGGGPPPRASS